MSTTTDTHGTPIGALDDFEDDTPKRVDIADQRLCVVLHEGEVYAVDDLCTHGHAFLSEGEFDPDECVLECPLHGGLFDARSGKACGAPASKPVRVYPTLVIEGKVYVDLD